LFASKFDAVGIEPDGFEAAEIEAVREEMVRLLFVWDEDGGFLQFNEAGTGSFLELGKNGIDFFAGLNEFDFDGQVIGDFENVRRVHAMLCAEARNAFDDGGAGDAGVKEEIEDGRVNRNAVMFGAVAEIERDFHGFA
jgi:hypothetical protein